MDKKFQNLALSINHLQKVFTKSTQKSIDLVKSFYSKNH